MGERKATNKYYPPDFDPRKHRSLDAYHGSHALRERARKLHEGILIIRFEMPYNIWCGGCGNHIGMGVRYNAEKSKNHDYVIIEGARRKEQRWDPKENEQIVPEDKNTQKKMATDAMYMLEHGVDDKAKIKAALPGIAQIEQLQTAWKDDYSLNKQLRNTFRAEKKALNDTEARDKALLQKSSLDINLVEEDEEDKRIAHLLNKYKTVSSFDERLKEKREEIANRPMFTGSNNSSPSVTSNSTQQLVKQLVARKQTSTFAGGEKTLTVGSLGISKTLAVPFLKIGINLCNGEIHRPSLLPTSLAGQFLL
ncbi:coiled-coil domain containing 130 [Lamellibrachia satsuma]|nr:coiled-coil domain containing 130 [Lamellibrachia satsuma]